MFTIICDSCGSTNVEIVPYSDDKVSLKCGNCEAEQTIVFVECE